MNERTRGTYPLVYFDLWREFSGRPSMIEDKGELCVEPVCYLVGLLGLIGHGRARGEYGWVL